MVTKEAALKFQEKLCCVSKKSLDRLGKDEFGYLLSCAPKPVKEKNGSQKKVKNIPLYTEKKILDKVEVPRVGFEELDPWIKTVELLNKCNNAIIKHNLDLAEVFYAQIEPFYNQLGDMDKRSVFFKVQELQRNIIELRMRQVKKIVKIIC